MLEPGQAAAGSLAGSRRSRRIAGTSSTMAQQSVAAILQQLDAVVGDELQARHCAA